MANAPVNPKKKSTFALPGDNPGVPVPGPPSEIRVRAVTSAVQDSDLRKNAGVRAKFAAGAT